MPGQKNIRVYREPAARRRYVIAVLTWDEYRHAIPIDRSTQGRAPPVRPRPARGAIPDFWLAKADRLLGHGDLYGIHGRARTHAFRHHRHRDGILCWHRDCPGLFYAAARPSARAVHARHREYRAPLLDHDGRGTVRGHDQFLQEHQYPRRPAPAMRGRTGPVFAG